jgi:hypothetical protein
VQSSFWMISQFGPVRHSALNYSIPQECTISFRLVLIRDFVRRSAALSLGEGLRSCSANIAEEAVPQ